MNSETLNREGSAGNFVFGFKYKQLPCLIGCMGSQPSDEFYALCKLYEQRLISKDEFIEGLSYLAQSGDYDAD